MDLALAFVERWGAWVYPALALYAAVKSGLLPVFAASAAAAGALDLGLVAVALFGGTVLGEEAKFHAGRWLVPRFASRLPRLSRAVERSRRAVERWGAAWVLLYRWPKGGRTLGALPIGAAGWPWRRFAWLNLAGAAIWSGGTLGLGWLGGATILAALDRWGGTITALLLLAMLILLVLAWRAARAPGEMK